MFRTLIAKVGAPLVALSFALLGVSVAQDSGGASAPSLTGITWEWRQFVDERHEKNLFVDTHSITFDEDGRYTGRADCNSMGGAFTTDGDSISIQPGPTTLMACLPGSLAEEFLAHLFNASTFSFTDTGDLLLHLASGGGTMRLSPRPQVSGTVTYLQRIALPENALVRVQLLDVTVPDAPTTIVAEQVFGTNGAQVPLPFNLSYSRGAVQETRRYSISARITDRDGRLLFVSDEYVPVITGGSPTSGVELVLVQIAR